MKKKLGFTLAEVLIVLGIIGIVAEYTIPTLMNSFKKQTYTVSLQKFYSNFQNGMKQYMVNQGCTDLICTGLFNGSSNTQAWQDAMSTALNQIFKIGNLYGSSNVALSSFNSVDLNKSGAMPYFYDEDGYNYSFMTVDGFLVAIRDYYPGNCTDFSSYPTARLYQACGYVRVDTNGFKPPNTQGRDFFMFYLGNDGVLYPYHGYDASKVGEAYWRDSAEGMWCGVPGSSEIPGVDSGVGCVARIMENGWNMDY